MRKYLNLIDSNCDVDFLSCPWFFIGTVLATGPECIINIYVILGRRNLFEMVAVRSACESRSVALVWRLGILVTFALFGVYKVVRSSEQNRLLFKKVNSFEVDHNFCNAC